MLEARLQLPAPIASECFSHPDSAQTILNLSKKGIIEADIHSLISSALDHPSANHIATIATNISWSKLWDLALDRGANGTSQIQRIVYHLSKATYPGFVCSLCDLPVESAWIDHICTSHNVTLDSIPLSPERITNLMYCADEKLFRIHFPSTSL